VETVASVLEEYAKRGIFRGFSRRPTRGGKAVFKMLWHRDRNFELIVDPARKTLRFPVVLPQVPAGSSMYAELLQFVEGRFAEDLPDHRRIDKSKATIQCGNRKGDVSLTLTVLESDYEYATRKLVNLVHEVFLVFLMDGRYYDYMVETFDLDPDRL
jgi:hypothetical protein